MSIVAFSNQRLWEIQMDINEGLIDINEMLLDSVSGLTWLVILMGVLFGIWLILLTWKVCNIKK